MIYFKCNNSR